jgi:hypothetical protein
MSAEDLLESILWAIPFLAIAGVLYAFAIWKKSKGKGLCAQARERLRSGQRGEARELFLQALWKANEEPSLERLILSDLSRLYGDVGPAFPGGDYEVLIGQFEQLSRKKSHKALSEMKQVQALKKELIGRMSRLA